MSGVPGVDPRRLTAALAASALAWAGLPSWSPAGAQADTGDGTPRTTRRRTTRAPGPVRHGAGDRAALDHRRQHAPHRTPPASTTSGMPFRSSTRTRATRPKIIDFYSGDPAGRQPSAVRLVRRTRSGTASTRGHRATATSTPASGPGTDLFHMRPVRPNTNSLARRPRLRRDGDSGGPVPGCPCSAARRELVRARAAIKGDLARGLFYMDVRYNGDARRSRRRDLRDGRDHPDERHAPSASCRRSSRGRWPTRRTTPSAPATT